MSDQPFAIVIPARFASTRYPGKPLVPLNGKSLIQRSWEAAMAVPGCATVIIATDDERIAQAARAFGATVAMTPEACANGTERCAAALSAIADDIDIIVNLQGDAPLTPPWFITAIVARLVADAAAAMATPVVRATPAVHGRLLADQAAGRVGGTTAAVSAGGRALYFSKAVIPHVPEKQRGDPGLPVFLHIGAYAYRRAGLAAYVAAPVSALELLEGLEQLRFLDADLPVAVAEVDPRGRDMWELNNPQDIAPIEAALTALGIA
ncbi:3-deoxy-manno-octulosonate cytidylyltransferase [Sphingomonas quercus]|uniref:3-deoxy-manno-octulosonate cytidylyltransferase n=1 Tax=Sphingomonas quercus TaxID=2842451 RepID=UPI00209AD632|nr:3-deoxy-manno-octulosonate cytidylyltransferase [Sphingomonas quercus]